MPAGIDRFPPRFFVTSPEPRAGFSRREPNEFVEPSTVDKTELAKLQAYLRRKFDLDTIKVVARPKKKDSAEVFIDDEFVAVIYRDEEDGEISWNFQMAILEMDLED